MYSTHSGVAPRTEQSSYTVTAATCRLAVLVWRAARVVVVYIEYVGNLTTDFASTSLRLAHLLVNLNRDPVVSLEIPILHAPQALCPVTSPFFSSWEPVSALATLLHTVFVQVLNVDGP